MNDVKGKPNLFNPIPKGEPVDPHIFWATPERQPDYGVMQKQILVIKSSEDAAKREN